MDITKYIDRYTLFARMLPATLSGILVFYLFNVTILDTLFSSKLAEIVTKITVLILAIYILWQIQRLFGKLLEWIIFKKWQKFPTTLCIQDKNNLLDKKTREDLISKVSKEYKLKTKEITNTQRVMSIIWMVRQKMKDWRLILNYNIAYWFSRNLLAGIIVISLVDMIYVIIKESIEVILRHCWISIVIILILLLLMFFYSREYAKQLFLEYLS